MRLKIRHSNKDRGPFDEVMSAQAPVESDELKHSGSRIVRALPPKLPLGVAIDELATIMAASEAGEWVDRVVYRPLS